MNKQTPNPDEMLIPYKCTLERCNDCPIYFDCLSSILKDDDINIYDPRDVDPDLFFDIMFR